MAKFFKGIEFIGYARDGKQGVDKVLSLEEKPDVILMDLRMPEMDGIETTKRILSISPLTKIIVVTAYLEEEDFFACFEAGAAGYILKNDTYWGELEKSIKKAFAGGIPISPDASHLLLKAWSSRKKTSVIELPSEPVTKEAHKVIKEEGKTCLTCGNINKTKAKYCEKCGNSLEKILEEPSVTEEKPVEDLYEHKKEESIYATKSFNEFDMFLLQLKSPSQKIRLEALNHISNSKDERRISALIDILDDPEAHLRKEAVILLGNHKDYRAFLPLMKKLKDNDLSVRLAVLDILARMKYKESVPYILEALKDENHQIRKYAAIALGESGDDRAVEPLKEARKKEGTFSISMKMIIDKAIQKIESSLYRKSISPDITDDAICVARCYNEAGEKCVRQNNYKPGLEYFLKALEIDQTCAEAHMNIARITMHEFKIQPDLKSEYKINEALLHLNECIAFASSPVLSEEARNYIGILIEEWNILKARREYVPETKEEIEEFDEESETEEEIEEYEEETETEEEIEEFEAETETEEEIEERDEGKSITFQEDRKNVEIYKEPGKHEEQTIYYGLLKSSPDDPVIHNRLALTYYKLKDYEKSLYLYKKALELDPEFSEAHYNIAILYMDENDFLQALKHFRLCINFSKDKLLIEKSKKYLQDLGEPEEIEILSPFDTGQFEEKVETEENIEKVDINSFDEKVNYYQGLLKTSPDDSDIHNKLGFVYYEAGDSEKASSMYRRALELNKDSPEAHFNLGLIYRDKKHILKALRHFRLCKKVANESSLIENAENYIRELEGHDEGSSSPFRTRVFKASDIPVEEEKTDKKEPDIKEEMEKASEENKKVIEELKKELKEKPGDLTLLHKLGEAYYKSGDLVSSLNNYLELLKINPSDGKAHFRVGLICREEKKVFKALVHFKKYMKLDPQGEYINEAKQYIKELE